MTLSGGTLVSYVGSMSERDEYPPGVPCWVDTLQPDLDSALKFYGGLFGWAFGGPGPMQPGAGGTPGRYFVARIRSRDVAGIGSQPAVGEPAMPAWTTHVAVTSAADTAADAARLGGTVLVPPFDALPAGRMAVLQDPGGAVFCAWEPVDRGGAQVVNEPRAWAMSTLVTSAPAACAEFYGKLFGWKTESFGTGPRTATLFRLPGYVGGEPRQPVPRDVVAVMAPGTASAPRGPSHWSVDFWIDDAEAAAGKATCLGGLLLGPVEARGMFRTAVIRDPQGAVFSISQLVGSAGA